MTLFNISPFLWHNSSMKQRNDTKPEDKRQLRTKQRIKKAFEQLLLEEGFDQLNVLKLTSKAKINRSTFYDHYADFDDLYQSIISELMENFTRYLVQEVFNEDGTINLEQLHKTIVLILDEITKQREYLINLIQTSDVRILKDRIVLTIVNRYHHEIERLSENARSHHDWELTVFYLTSVLYGFLNYWINATNPISSEEMAASMIDLVLHGYQ